MMMRKPLTGRQLAIMQTLWDRGEATVGDVQTALAAAGDTLAYSTLATLLSRLERKGLVTHREEGRSFVYAPVVSQERVSSSLVADLLGRFFGGQPSQLVSYLLQRDEIDPQELERIKALVAQHQACPPPSKPRGGKAGSGQRRPGNGGS